jgi:GTP-binding protein Era
MKSGFCVLWGRPNVGKSTLLNALLGRKHVIVSPRPQTTRHRITGVLNDPQEEYQVVFLDTPGIHAPQHKLGEALIKTAKGALEDIECLLLVADATDEPHDDDLRAVQLLQRVDIPVLLVLNKIDAAQDVGARRAEFEKLRKFDGVFEISAQRGDGLEELKAAIVQHLPEGEAYFPPDMIGDRSPEFHLSEFIREQALLQLRQEVPHAVAVTIEQMEPRPRGLLYIEAFLIVERGGQKQIVIGENGARLKEIGQKARAEMEEFLGRKVFLDLRVKVRDKWRESDSWVKRLGYQEN